MQARAASYLDHNSGSPLSPRAREAILTLLGGGLLSTPFLQGGNPSSSHGLGRHARKLLAQAREQVSASLGNPPTHEIIFTSSGTEASQQAIRSVLESAPSGSNWILGAGEHEATDQMAAWFESRGGTSRFLPLLSSGAPDLGRLSALCDERTVLVSHLWVNNETGVITDVRELSRIARDRAPHSRVHLDGAQAWGKVPVSLSPDLADFVSFSGSKIGGLGGSGALWISPRARVGRLLLGTQESARRGGTENLLAAVALGAAASEVDGLGYSRKFEGARQALEAAVLALVPGARVHGRESSRVANTSNFGFEGVEREGLVTALDLAGFCVSAGSACSSGVAEPSRVLRAMGLTEGQARGGLRVSLGTGTQEAVMLDWIPLFARAVLSAVEQIRKGGRV